jgi:hypothetical protein
MKISADLVSKYRNRGVLVDTNILLLWMVGVVDSSWISKHKRTKQYTAGDYIFSFDFSIYTLSNSDMCFYVLLKKLSCCCKQPYSAQFPQIWEY